MARWFSLAVFFLSFIFLPGNAAKAQRNDIFVTPIPNAPFTAVINVERSFVQKDGSIVRLKTIREIGRDSKGRIFNEGRALQKPEETGAPQVLRVHLYDPQTRVSTMINPQMKTFWTGTVNRPPETVPPAALSTPGAHSLPQNEFTREEDLGTRQIDGLSVRGMRETQTLPAANGSGEAVVTDEFWYSDDLRIDLLLKHSDPTKGSVTMTVTNVSRAEPDPSKFEIPPGFRKAGPGE